MSLPIKFKIEKEMEGHMGRAGVLETLHGTINTPAFVPVATKATLKGLLPKQIKDLNVQVILANTYHLYLEPGDERIVRAGGLHTFMNWDGPIMTDSGGFQVFSLGAAFGNEIKKISRSSRHPREGGDPELQIPRQARDDNDPDGRAISEHFKPAKIDPKGVTFRSHIDGSAHYFTPQKSMEIQHNLGADIIFAFDECTATGESDHYQAEALDRTHRWAQESLDFHKLKQEQANKQALFGIVQGGRVEKLRKESAEVIAGMRTKSGESFDGFGIGGGFEKEDMSSSVEWVNEILPKEKPRHLLGIGEPEDLLMAIERGCDLFDCVAPTRLARTGTIYTKRGKVNLMRSEFRDDFSLLDEESDLLADRQYTKAYLAHLFRTNEMLGAIIASQHNVYFINKLVADARETILAGKFLEFKEDFLREYKQ